MKFPKILFALAAAATLFSSMSTTARADALDDIVKSGVLKVAVPQDFPPFGSVTSDLKPQGLDIDVATLIAKNPPKKPETKFLIKNSPCSIGLSKDEPKLLEKVNAILAQTKKDGELNALSVKWLGLPLPANL